MSIGNWLRRKILRAKALENVGSVVATQPSFGMLGEVRVDLLDPDGGPDAERVAVAIVYRGGMSHTEHMVALTMHEAIELSCLLDRATGVAS